MTTQYPKPIRQRKPSVSNSPSALSRETTLQDSPSVSRRKWLTPSEWDVLVLSTFVKVLLFPAYFSTDFEVHRNWLAITHSLPLSKWYLDATSEWTLDYPPFFAYFEYLLSLPATLIDPYIVDLQNLNYSDWSCIAFQRSTVILTELVMGAALLRFIRAAADPSTQRIVSMSLFLHPGFLIVDHIHFQYNGFLFGILLWSVLKAKEGNLLFSGLLFAILLNFKHIYLYLAPAYFVYLLRAYCMGPKGTPLLRNFVQLAGTVVFVFALSLGPFVLLGQIPQLLSRLFPFTRGLNHAYWAPNAWALVTALDRLVLQYARRSGREIIVDTFGVVSSSRGLVGDTHFATLPNVKPGHTFALTIASQLIFLVKLWRKPDYKSFITALTLCGYSSFMFGWHVHEKAVLLILVPLSLLAGEDYQYFRTFVLASVAGIFSLLPLLFTPAEWIVKLAYAALWAAVVFPSLGRRVYRPLPTTIGMLIHKLESLYFCLFPLLQLFVTIFPTVSARLDSSHSVPPTAANLTSSADPLVEPTSSLLFPTPLPQLEFLPLMLTSVYCAVGMTWAFIRLSYLYLSS